MGANKTAHLIRIEIRTYSRVTINNMRAQVSTNKSTSHSKRTTKLSRKKQ